MSTAGASIGGEGPGPTTGPTDPCGSSSGDDAGSDGNAETDDSTGSDDGAESDGGSTGTPVDPCEMAQLPAGSWPGPQFAYVSNNLDAATGDVRELGPTEAILSTPQMRYLLAKRDL